MKLWNERDFDECCYPVSGLGRFTMVCAEPCRGSYCGPHRDILNATFAERPRVVQANRMKRRAGRPAPPPIVRIAKPKPPKVAKAPKVVKPKKPKPYRPSDDELQALALEIARAYLVPVKEMLGEGRRRPLTNARQEFFYWAYRLGATTVQIGAFCGRDHSTVCWGIRRHKERLAAAFGMAAE